METAIKKAIEGGYDYVGLSREWKDCILKNTEVYEKYGHTIAKARYISNEDKKEYGSDRRIDTKNYYDILLDPLFWQALGKAEGWVVTICWFCGKECEIAFSEDSDCCNEKVSDEWEYRWHSFIDHLAAGKDINSFFDNLIK